MNDLVLSLRGIESMYSLHGSRGETEAEGQGGYLALPCPAMGSQMSCSLQRRPSCLALTKSVGPLEGFAPPERLRSFHGRSVSLMEPKLRFFFFSLPHLNKCPHCSLAPREFHIHKRGDLLQCPPKGTSKEQLSWRDWINGI